MSRSQKTQGLFSDNGIDQMAGNASVNKTSEGTGAWKQVPIEGRLQRWGLAFGSTCKRFKVHDHSRDMIRLCFRESKGESLEKG